MMRVSSQPLPDAQQETTAMHHNIYGRVVFSWPAAVCDDDLIAALFLAELIPSHRPRPMGATSSLQYDLCP